MQTQKICKTCMVLIFSKQFFWTSVLMKTFSLTAFTRTIHTLSFSVQFPVDAFNFFKTRFMSAVIEKLLSIWYKEHWFHSTFIFLFRFTWKSKKKFILSLLFFSQLYQKWNLKLTSLYNYMFKAFKKEFASKIWAKLLKKNIFCKVFSFRSAFLQK